MDTTSPEAGVLTKSPFLLNTLHPVCSNTLRLFLSRTDNKLVSMIKTGILSVVSIRGVQESPQELNAKLKAVTKTESLSLKGGWVEGLRELYPSFSPHTASCLNSDFINVDLVSIQEIQSVIHLNGWLISICSPWKSSYHCFTVILRQHFQNSSA